MPLTQSEAIRYVTARLTFAITDDAINGRESTIEDTVEVARLALKQVMTENQILTIAAEALVRMVVSITSKRLEEPGMCDATIIAARAHAASMLSDLESTMSADGATVSLHANEGRASRN